jgi:hypothetical protein
MSSSAAGYDYPEAKDMSPTPTGPQTVADHVLGDQPAETKEQDKLGFGPYVAAVAKFLTDKSTKTPLTLSVEGLWGSGKSSFMKQLEEALTDLGKTKIVSFNAWQYNADDGLWAAFLSEFDAKLNGKLNWREKLIARYRLIKLRISWQDSFETIKALLWLAGSLVIALAVVRFFWDGGLSAFRHSMEQTGDLGKSAIKSIALIGGAGGAIAILALFLYQVKGLFKSPASLQKAAHLFAKTNYETRLPLIRQVTRDFERLVSAHAGDDNVYVFIDDLDRCEYSRAAELIQALLMLLSSAPKIALIIGLDREKVAAALAAKQEKLLPYLYQVSPADIYSHGIRYGQRFIEKFIQLSYILPSPKAQGLESMINPAIAPPETPGSDHVAAARVIEIVTGKDDSGTLNTLIEMADQVFDHNPRNVKQFVNAFRLQAFIANETGLFRNPHVTRSGAPLTLPQLGKFVALCMRWPEFVEEATVDPKLTGNMEHAIHNPTDASGTGYLDSKFPGWRQDRGFRALMVYRSDDPEFLCSDIDFRVLSEISPARAKTASDSSKFSESSANPTGFDGSQQSSDDYEEQAQSTSRSERVAQGSSPRRRPTRVASSKKK